MSSSGQSQQEKKNIRRKYMSVELVFIRHSHQKKNKEIKNMHRGEALTCVSVRLTRRPICIPSPSLRVLPSSPQIHQTRRDTQIAVADRHGRGLASAPPHHGRPGRRTIPRAHVPLLRGRRRRRHHQPSGDPRLPLAPPRQHPPRALRRAPVVRAGGPLGALPPRHPGRGHLPPPEEPGLLPRQLRRGRRAVPGRVAPRAPVLAGRAAGAAGGVVPPLRAPPRRRAARRRVRPHLLRPRGAGWPRRRVRVRRLPHVRGLAHLLRARARCGGRVCPRRVPRA